MSDVLYHIKINKNDSLPRYLLTCGDPQRAKWIADDFLENSKELAHNREYWTFQGSYKGTSLLVSSFGIGSPSTAIGLEEFGQCGVDTFIRMGTSGAVSRNLKLGSILNVTGAVRAEGTSIQYVPIEYPAIASHEVVQAIDIASHNLNLSVIKGLTHSKDSFYSEHPNYSTFPEKTKQSWKTWELANVLSTEMECSVLFVLAQIRKWRSGSVLAVIGSTWEENPISSDPKQGQKEAITIALEAIHILALNDEHKLKT